MLNHGSYLFRDPSDQTVYPSVFLPLKTDHPTDVPVTGDLSGQSDQYEPFSQ